MNKICTDIKQSKKLIELGLNSITSDMTYYWFHDGENDSVFYELELCKGSVNDNDIPAWSLSALLDLLPSCITMQKIDGKHYACMEMKNEEKGEFGSIIYSCVGINIIDVVFDLMVWYLKNREL